MTDLKPWWQRHAGNPDYVDLHDQEELFKAETGDKPWYLGFDRRFAAWCEAHPRKDLSRS